MLRAKADLHVPEKIPKKRSPGCGRHVSQHHSWCGILPTILMNSHNDTDPCKCCNHDFVLLFPGSMTMNQASYIQTSPTDQPKTLVNLSEDPFLAINKLNDFLYKTMQTKEIMKL